MSDTTDRREWCFGPEGHCRIAELLRHMRDSDDGLTVEQAIEIVERPWRWTDEWEAISKEKCPACRGTGGSRCDEHQDCSEPCDPCRECDGTGRVVRGGLGVEYKVTRPQTSQTGSTPFTVREEGALFRVYCFDCGMYPIGSREDAERLKRSLDYEWARR